MSLSKKLKFEILKRDKFTCQYCGKKAPDVVLEVDHIIPKSKMEFGADDIENLITSCFECNRGKRDHLLENIMHNKNIDQEIEKIKQQEIKLIRLNEVKREIANRTAKEINDLTEYFASYYKSFELATEVFEKVNTLLKTTLNYFDFYAVKEWMEIAMQRTNNCFDAKSYFAGIMHNKMKDLRAEKKEIEESLKTLFNKN